MSVPSADRASRWGEMRLPLLVSGALALAAILGSSWIRWEVRRLQFERFERLTDRVQGSLGRCFSATEQALLGLDALVENTEYAPHAEHWNAHVERVRSYLGPGVVGLGYVRRVDRAAAPELQAEMRRLGYEGFVVDAAGAHPRLYVVTNIAPLAEHASLLGEDLADGTTRRKAAESAMRRGAFEISRQIRIVQADRRVPGMLLFLPVYRGGDVPPVPVREAGLVGWVYASLRPDLMFAGVSGSVGTQMALQVFQEGPVGPDTLLFSSGPEAAARRRTFTRTQPLEQYGQRWTLWVGTTPAFDEAGRTFLAPAVLVAGLLVALLAGGLTWALASARRRALDLAERMTADLRRTEREAQRLALVASRTANAVVLADPEWRIEWVNDGFTRLTGFTLDEVRGRRPTEFLVGPGTDQALQRAMAEADRLGHRFTGEVLNYRKDRTPFWVEIEIQPLFDSHGRRTGVMALQLDITARKRIEAELAQRMAEVQRLALVASRAASSVIITDPHWRIEWVNESFTRLFGYTLADVHGSRPSERLGGPGTSPEVVAAIDRAAQRDELFKGEILIYTKSGRPIWIRLEIQPLFDDDGHKLGYLGLLLDISELKRQAAELLSAKEAAEQANIAKSQFLAMMSHEIRTPMNGVIGMASLLLESALTPAQREYAETIRQSGETLLTIINDILDFSKIESGRMELAHEPFPVRPLVEGALDLLSPAAGGKRLDLLFEVAEDVPERVRGDPTRLRQVVVNLLSNAVKFTERGEVVLSVKVESRAGQRCELRFAVSDTGIGIPLEALDRLFQSFSQVDPSLSRRFGGTGLGLVISKRLVELMGGRLWVESTAGQGSTFTFIVPLPIEAGPPRLGEMAGPALPAGCRLLLVDDNATARRILRGLAERWGLEVVDAPSAAEAVARLELPGGFHAAIIDLHLSDGGGTELARRLREHPRGRDLPLLVVSSPGAEPAAAVEGIFAAVLSRPVKPTALQAALARVLARGSDPAPPAVPDTGAPHRPARSERVLLAEDNPVNLRVARHMLARLGYRADVAIDGHEALAAVARQPYDVILMDVQMPGIDGLETTRRIRAHRDLPVRPWIIALTANAMPGDREACLAAGMDDYLGKPLTLDQLARTLARVPKS